MGIAFDVDTGKLWFSKNGTWISGDPADGSSPSATVPSAELANDIYPWGASGSNTHYQGYDFGQSGFRDDPPTGFSALSTANFDDPTIADPSAYFQTTLYTGNDGSNEIDQAGNSTFEPNLVWLKERSGGNHGTIIDSVRGGNKGIYPSLNNAEYTETNLSFDADGFSLSATGSAAQVNASGQTYIGWQWLEGATPGFDIVSFTGNATNRTISHSVGVAPEFMVVKNLADTDNWAVYHASNTSAPETDYLILNTDAATADDATIWNDTAPTSSVFSVGTSSLTNGNTEAMIAYLWAGVEGFSKFGKYTGNNNADGPFVWCGFKPAWLCIKCSSGIENWFVGDNKRLGYNLGNRPMLSPNTAAAEDTSWSGNAPFDLLSNGFKIRRTGDAFNTDGGTYLFIAFANTPFKTATAR
jgi:hypothetical protein